MEVLVCVKRVPATGGRITLTEDEQSIDTKFLGFTVSPHEECAVEEAVRLVEAHGGSSTVLTLGPEVATEQLRRRDRHRRRPRDPAGDRRRRMGPGGDGRRDRGRGPRRAGGRPRVRRPALRQRGGRHRRLPGGDPRGARPRPAVRDGHQGARGVGRDRHGAARERVGRMGDLRGRTAGRLHGQGGDQPAPLPIGPRTPARQEEGDRADRAHAPLRRARADPAEAPARAGRRGRDPRQGPRGGGGRGRGPSAARGGRRDDPRVGRPRRRRRRTRCRSRRSPSRGAWPTRPGCRWRPS